jgi:hypothetical protein
MSRSKETIMEKRNMLLAAAIAAGLGISSQAPANEESAQRSSYGDHNAMTNKYSSSGSGTAASQADRAQRSSSPSAAGPALLVLMPVTRASPDSLGNGCWARLYDGQNFSGDNLSLIGPIEMPNMRTAFGRDWSGEFDSVAVGPNAQLTVYDNEDYSQRVSSFEPGQKIANLGGELGFFEQVRSLKLACNNQRRANGMASTEGDSRTSEAEHAGTIERFRSFGSLDKDGDGSISRAEWNQSWGQTAAAN